MIESAARLGFGDLAVGQQASFDTRVSAEDIDRFIELSGDTNPLHRDADFARSRGFPGRVVHGALIGALVSRLVGVHLPGENCIVHAMSLQFRSPLIAGSPVRVSGEVDQVSEAVQAMVVKVAVTALDDGRIVASGKVNIGFTAATNPARSSP